MGLHGVSGSLTVSSCDFHGTPMGLSMRLRFFRGAPMGLSLYSYESSIFFCGTLMRLPRDHHGASVVLARNSMRLP